MREAFSPRKSVPVLPREVMKIRCFSRPVMAAGV
jgi:hypothetical protein